MTPEEIMREAARDAAVAKMRDQLGTFGDEDNDADAVEIADAVLDALAPYLLALRADVSRGYARARGKGAAQPIDPALLSPTTTAEEAGIPEGSR